MKRLDQHIFPGFDFMRSCPKLTDEQQLVCEGPINGK